MTTLPPPLGCRVPVRLLMPRLRRGLAATCFLVLPSVAWAWSPGVAEPEAVGSPASPLVVDTRVRNDVLSFYHCVYKASQGGNADIGWTGNLATCTPGTTTEVFKDDVRRRINWYRAMAGMPADIVFNPDFNEVAQAAALIMAQQNELSHDPAAAFGKTGCWSEAGQTGASRGNLALGLFGAEAINGYVEDPGVDDVGHRAWMLYARGIRMGTGDVPASGAGDHPSINCLHVVDSAARRAPSGLIHSWPPAGFVPAPTVFRLWSLQADTFTTEGPTFETTAVSMKFEDNGQTIPVRITHRHVQGLFVPAPSLVWEPDWTTWRGNPPLERAIRVEVTSITPGGTGLATTHAYTVTVIDPDVVTDALAITGSTAAPLSGIAYKFAGLTNGVAERYELAAQRVVAKPVTEGAESTSTVGILDQTAGGRPLRINLPRSPAPPAGSGSRCFHMVIPDGAHDVQAFELDVSLMPSAASQLKFSRRFGWLTDDTRLDVLISTDQRKTWQSIWQKAGANSFERAWSQATVSLAPWTGQIVRLQFRLTRVGEEVYSGTTSEFGVLLDTITITAVESTEPGKITPIEATQRSFVFDTTTAGQSLATGDNWLLQVRPVLGHHTFPFSTPHIVNVAPAVQGFAHWAATRLPGVTATGFTDDPEGLGLPHGVRYAFGLKPDQPAAAPPAPTFHDGYWSLAFDPAILPYPVTGVRFAAESSSDCQSWYPLVNESTTAALRFPLPAAPGQFVRWKVTAAP